MGQNEDQIQALIYKNVFGVVKLRKMTRRPLLF